MNKLRLVNKKLGIIPDLKLTKHVASPPGNTSKSLLATNMFYTSQTADCTSLIKPSMSAKITPKPKRRQSRGKITEPGKYYVKCFKYLFKVLDV